ncbi:GPI-anchored small secreted protein [Laccaria bicolor S238N-H82]|uniref:GPI-anchored small secreted protein n=1 Tax=Laccaria bicolor (strain S238N-H82 / ATCC MYA-4686) TaxID=486041 RepID=B0DDX1_LACBS|nr:GPI-anchored small secreted protein [Laccaria bicolor S238N-H82]EDR07160.1 GPI-anchored small secreted protein [Laccaria bicolor S238N-H82]|eukprot:XP_001882091.1 GPI-anchored small secreted protein [Laccaria bicolor S238N-H82]
MAFLLLVDLLLSHHPIKGAEGSAGGGAGVIRTGRGRKVRARFGEGKFVEENKGDVEKGKGKEDAEGREMAVERREREVEEKEENVEEEWECILLKLVVSTRPLRRSHGPSLSLFFSPSSFKFPVLGDNMSSFPLEPNPPSSCNPSSSSSSPLIPVLPPPSPLKEDPDANGKPDAICTYQQVDGGVTSYSWVLACALLC